MLYAIIIYVIIMIIIIMMKPEFIYDHNKLQFKEFGFTKGKSFVSLGSLSIVMAASISIFFLCLCKTNNTDDIKKNIQYIQVPYYQPQMPLAPYQQQYYQPMALPQI